jgi:hypothetical protein
VRSDVITKGSRQRKVCVSGPDADDRVELQLGELSLHKQGALDRDVRVVRDEAGPFAVVLIGRDGGEKARWTEPVAATEIWERIDAMPMRRSELRDR